MNKEQCKGRMRLTIEGPVPSKKNAYSRSKSGRMFKNKALQAKIDAIVIQIQAQYKGKPLMRPSISVHFVCKDQRSDLDNKYTCLQDCLVLAGVLDDDNLNHLRGPITISGSVGKGQELTWVEIE